MDNTPVQYSHQTLVCQYKITSSELTHYVLMYDIVSPFLSMLQPLSFQLTTIALSERPIARQLGSKRPYGELDTAG